MERQCCIDSETQIDLVPASPHFTLRKHAIGQCHSLLFPHSRPDGCSDGRNRLLGPRELFQQFGHVEDLTDGLDGSLTGLHGSSSDGSLPMAAIIPITSVVARKSLDAMTTCRQSRSSSYTVDTFSSPSERWALAAPVSRLVRRLAPCWLIPSICTTLVANIAAGRSPIAGPDRPVNASRSERAIRYCLPMRAAFSRPART